MTESIHEALWEWFLTCPAVKRLYFNFSGTEDGATVISPSGDTLLEEYIDGSQRRRYAFELIFYLPAAFDANDPSNVDMLEEAESVADWVRAQNDDGAFPVFPAGKTVENVGVLDESAGYAAAQNEEKAKYMIPFAIDYMKE